MKSTFRCAAIALSLTLHPSLSFANDLVQAAATNPKDKNEYTNYIISTFRQRFSRIRVPGQPTNNAILKFTIQKDGKVTESKVAQSTGNEAIDAEIEKIFRSGSTVAAFPNDMEQDSIAFSLPIKFNNAVPTSTAQNTLPSTSQSVATAKQPPVPKYNSTFDYLPYIGLLGNGFSSLGALSYLEGKGSEPCLSQGATDRRGNPYNYSTQLASCDSVISEPAKYGFLPEGREVIYAYYQRGWLNTASGNKVAAKRDFEQFLSKIDYDARKPLTLAKVNGLGFPGEIIADSLFGLIKVSENTDRAFRLTASRQISKLLFDYTSVDDSAYIGAYGHDTSVRACMVAAVMFGDGAAEEAETTLLKSVSGKLGYKNRTSASVAAMQYAYYVTSFGKFINNLSDLTNLESPAKEAAYSFHGSGMDFSGNANHRNTCNEFALLHSFYYRSGDLRNATAALIPAWLAEKESYEGDARFVQYRVKFLQPLQQAADNAVQSGALKQVVDDFRNEKQKSKATADLELGNAINLERMVADAYWKDLSKSVHEFRVEHKPLDGNDTWRYEEEADFLTESKNFKASKLFISQKNALEVSISCDSSNKELNVRFVDASAGRGGSIDGRKLFRSYGELLVRTLPSQSKFGPSDIVSHKFLNDGPYLQVIGRVNGGAAVNTLCSNSDLRRPLVRSDIVHNAIYCPTFSYKPKWDSNKFKISAPRAVSSLERTDNIMLSFLDFDVVKMSYNVNYETDAGTIPVKYGVEINPHEHKLYKLFEACDRDENVCLDSQNVERCYNDLNERSRRR